MLLNIVTLTYNQSPVIQNLAKSLIENCGHHFADGNLKWIVRDNGSDRAGCSIKNIFTMSHLEGSHKFIEVIDCKNEGNFASMHNDLRQSIKDSVFTLFLNDDTIALHDFITPMLELLQKNPSIGAVGANLTYPDGKIQHAGVVISEDKTPYNVGDNSFKYFGFSEMLPGGTRHFQACTGACLMVRTQDFLGLGGFDPQFNWCFDDVDLCLQIKHLLKKDIVYCHEAKMIHLENTSIRKALRDGEIKNLSVKENHMKLVEKWNSILQPDAFLYKANYGFIKGNIDDKRN
jgi:GT2 family glycosyltransferase